MRMTEYLEEVAFADERLMQAIWHERNELQQLGDRARELTEQTVRDYLDSSTNASDELDDDGLGTARYWYTYFGIDQTRLQTENVRVVMTAQLGAHAFSIASLSGALIQVAQQGIAIAHGGPGPIPGRLIGTTQHLGTIIWEARNQAMHWDTGSLHPKAETCFKKLAAGVDGKFSDYNNRSLAFDVVELLDWRTVDQCTADLVSLG